jgi:single-strand DNA-binding protein
MTATTDGSQSANTVFLRGVLAAAPTTRTLPSGDEQCSFRVNVRRPVRPARRGRATVDSIDCAATSASVRRAATRFRPGEIVEVSGRLQRRFWRGPGGVASRYEVEVDALRRPVRTRSQSDRKGA